MYVCVRAKKARKNTRLVPCFGASGWTGLNKAARRPKASRLEKQSLKSIFSAFGYPLLPGVKASKADPEALGGHSIADARCAQGGACRAIDPPWN